MVLPLLPFIPAGIAALGGAARFFGSPTGQRTVQGGINLVNRGLTGLQTYANPIINRAFGTQIGVPIQQQVVPKASAAAAPAFLSMYADNPAGLITDAGYFTGAQDAGNLVSSLTGGEKGESGIIEDLMSIKDAFADDKTAADVEEELEKEIEKEEKKKKKKKKKDDDEKKKDDDKEQEPSLDMIPLKKGGYVKKKRKRKPYKPSSFVKMKGRKKYI